MAFCRECGSEILAEAEICPKCGVRQNTSEHRNPVKTAFCRKCGSEILAEAEICPKCGVRQKTNEHKSPVIAAVLSFIWVGLGQIYNGQVGKGILFMVLQIFNAFLIAFAIGFVTVPAFWLYGIYDAYTIAEKINNNEEVPKNVSVKF